MRGLGRRALVSGLGLGVLGTERCMAWCLQFQVLAWCDELEQNSQKHHWAAVWRLTRKIAGTNVGPKLRRFDQLQPTCPSVDDWTKFLKASGPEGGCEASVVYRSDSQASRPVEQIVASMSRVVPKQELSRMPGAVPAIRRLEPFSRVVEPVVVSQSSQCGSVIGCEPDMVQGACVDPERDVAERDVADRTLARSNLTDLEVVTAAQEDLDSLRRCLVRGKHRKSVPEWSLPLEVWQLLLCRRLRRWGLWRHAWLQHHKDPGWMCVPALERLLFHMLCAIRRTNRPVKLWSTSQTVQLNKRNGKAGCTAIRLIHLLDPVGKGFFKGIWDRHNQRDWDFAYGFAKGKRRESAILQQRVLRHTLRRRGHSVHTGFFDVSHAFPSPDHKALDALIGSCCRPADVELLQRRHRDALMNVSGSEGHSVRPLCRWEWFLAG